MATRWNNFLLRTSRDRLFTVIGEEIRTIRGFVTYTISRLFRSTSVVVLWLALSSSFPLTWLMGRELRHPRVNQVVIEVSSVERNEIKLFIPGEAPVKTSDEILSLYSLRVQKVLDLRPERSDRGDSIYRWSETSSKGEAIPAGIYLLSLSVADVTYGWSLRYHGEGLGLEGGHRAFVLSRGEPVEKNMGGEGLLRYNGFLDETDLRLPSLQDGTSRVLTSDVDGDNDIDILLAEGGTFAEQNRIWLNDGRGFFADRTSQSLPQIEDHSNDLDLADVDGDNDADLVIANSFPSNNYILLNDGNGNFTEHPELLPSTGDISYGVRLCDVTGDGGPDVIFANVLWRNRLFRNDGAGMFTDISEESLPFDLDDSVELCCQDVNGDSARDLIFFNWDPNAGIRDRLLINDGTGTFHDSTTALMPDIGNASLDGESVDLDGNGYADMVVAEMPLFPDSGGQVPGTGQNLVLINNSQVRPGQFLDESASRMPSLFEWSDGVGTGDIDGVNGPDLVFANTYFGAGTLNRLYLNNGQGFFSDVTNSWLPFREELSTDIAVSDLDGDGDNDLLITNIPDTLENGAQNRILINQTLSGIGDLSAGPVAPSGFSLSQNYPNPFNPITSVEITIPEKVVGETFLGIYTLRGRLVKVIDDRRLPPGRHRYTWDGTADDGENLPSGVYILRLRSQMEVLTRKLSLIK